MTLDDIKKNLAWFGAGAGASVPCISFFSDFPPTFFSEISLIITPIAGALIYIIYKLDLDSVSWLPKKDKAVKVGSILLGVAIASLIFYFVFKNETSVQIFDSNSETTRTYQIGFGKSDWSLTNTGSILKTNYPDETLKNWMLLAAAFDDDGPSKIWKSWSIVTAGLISIALYMMGFLCWTCSFALLAKSKGQNE